MGYVAVRGGGRAIEESLKLLEFERISGGEQASVAAIQSTFPDLVDQVMGESSLYAPRLAALAIKQAQGSPEEAVFLLRAFRSTLERPYTSLVVDTERMDVERRISAAFKDVPGGQILGSTRDYSHRLIDFSLESEDAESVRERVRDLAAELAAGEGPAGEDPAVEDGRLPKVCDYLRQEGLLRQREDDDTPPRDATMEPLSFPAPRSIRLQTLSRGMTQAVSAFGYAAIRGFGPAHPTVGELRRGNVPVAVAHPVEPGGPEDAYYLGSIPVTEVESLFEVEREEDGEHKLSFEIGYGLTMGRCETKAIAMSVLDHCLEIGDKKYPTQDEEFVLYHVDGVEATGFISHLKLPHYVTFQSKLGAVRSAQGTAEEEE